MRRYFYDGPVMVEDGCILNKWKASTMAESSKQAKNNLAYRFKKENNIFMGTRINLPGKLESEE